MAALTAQSSWNISNAQFSTGPQGITVASGIRKVRAFYIEASDSTTTANYHSLIDNVMKEAQAFFADQMELNGYGRQTFELVTDSNGNADLGNKVVLPNNSAHYTAANADWRLLSDIRALIRADRTRYPENEILMFFTSIQFSGIGGFALPGWNLGVDSGTVWNARTTAHEIGHILRIGGVPGNSSDYGLHLAQPGYLMSRAGGTVLLPANAQILNDTSAFYTDDAKLYAFQETNVKRFTLDGTYESSGDATITLLARPTTVPSSYSERKHLSLIFHNSEWYSLVSYRNPSTSQYWHALSRYQKDFTFEEMEWVIDTGSTTFHDIKIEGSNVFLLSSANQIETRSLSTGARSSVFSVGSAATGFDVTDSRFYVVTNSLIKAFDRSGAAVTADDTTLTGVSTAFPPFGAGVSEDTLYFGGSTSSTSATRTVFRYTGATTAASITYSASFSSAEYQSATRTIAAVLTLSEHPLRTFSAANDFEVQERSGSPGSYTWTRDSAWNIDSLGGGTTRIIAATAQTTVTAGYYRLVLKQNAFGSGKPNANIATNEFPVGAYAGHAQAPAGMITDEDVSSGLTAQSSWNIDTSAFPSLVLLLAELGVTTNGTNVYVFDNQNIKKFSPTGTYDSTADVAYAEPPKPSAVPDSHWVSTTSDIAYYNNSWYMLVRYQNYLNLRAGVTFWYSLHRYNTSFVHQATLWTIGPISAYYRDMKVDANNVYLVNHTEQVITRRLSDGVLTAAFSIGPETTGPGATALAVTPTRFYVVEDTSIRAFDRSGNRVTTDDTTLTGFTNSFFPNGGGLIGNTFYFGGSTSTAGRTNTVFRYTGAAISAPPYTANWTNATYTPTNRSISDTITLSENPGSAFNASNDFEVELRTGTPGVAIAWIRSPNWTITSTGSGTSRVITAAPANTIAAGNYRLALKEDAFGTDKPNTKVVSQYVAVENYSPTPITYFARWTGINANSSTREITGYLRLSEDPSSSLSATEDFVVRVVTARTLQSHTSVISSGWSFTVTGSGTRRTVVAAPASTVPAGEYQLEVKRNAFGTNKPDFGVTSGFVNIGAYIDRTPPSAPLDPGVYSATWATPIYNCSTRVISTVLTLSEDPGSGFSVTNDFEVQRRSGSLGSYSWAEDTGWTLTSPGPGTDVNAIEPIITATPASTVTAGIYRIVLKEDAFGTDKPESNIFTSDVAVGASSGYTAVWESPRYITSTRVINAVIVLSEDPGSAFSAINDFKVEKRSGSVGSYTWAEDTDWTLSSMESGISRTITATPDTDVAAGTYRLTLKEDAFGTDKPNADVIGSEVTVAAYTAPMTSMAPNVSDLAYQNNEVNWRIEILGQDISSYIPRTDVGSIRQTLDTGFLTEFQTGDCQLTLQDPEGVFSTAKETNFFTERSWANTGYLAELKVFGGYRDRNGTLEETLVFNGSIISVTQDTKTRSITIVASENADISRENITNFGLSTGYTLPGSAQTSIRGTYDFDPRLSPISENSVSATLKGTTSGGSAYSQVMAQKNTLDDYGDLQETNFAVQHSEEQSQLLTEKAVTSLTNPRVESEFRAPFRYKTIYNTIRDIADHYGIRISDLNVADTQTEGHHFSALGRPGYNVETGTNNLDQEFSWKGNVTDFIIDEGMQRLYFLLSSRTSTVKPKLVCLDILSDEWTVLTEAATHEEWWKLATVDFDTFYILKTTGIFEQGLPRLATYNPSEYNFAAIPQTGIRKYVASEGTSENIITSNTERPQLAMYYHYGFVPGNVTTYTSEERFGFLPDTRHQFQISRGVLWYRYANRINFGLARYKDGSGVTQEITIARDGRNNEASFDFAIDEANNRIYGSHTAQTSTRSRLFLYYKTLAASY